jgi:zinc transport system substrate-binding protein
VKRLKVMIVLLGVILTVGIFSGCRGEVAAPLDEKKVLVVTTLFPQYDFVKNIGGERVELTLLLPPGAEPHSYEPTPRDILNIQRADVFIYTGEQMEPWAHRVLAGVKKDSLVVVDTSTGIELMEGHDHDHADDHDHDHDHDDDHDDDHDHDHDDDHDHDHDDDHDDKPSLDQHNHDKDPHIWLDPVLAQKMVENIVVGLVAADPEYQEYYEQKGEAYKEELKKLHEKYEETFKNTTSKTIIYGGHFAFGYMAKRYGLEHISPYKGFAPDAEPTPRRIAELIQTIEDSNAKVIYYEELIDPRVARVISQETGAEMILLHGGHNISKQELEAGRTYVDIMEENLKKLKLGLGYNG